MATLANGWVKAQERDTSAFERLFAAEYRKVAAIAYRVVGDPHEAEDVAQDVFCSFYRRHSPDASYAAPWLYRAAAHTALNVIRGRRRRSKREVDDAIERERLVGVAQASLDPQQALEEAERDREVRAALGRLSEKNATVLAMRYSGLSYAEIAAALHVGVGQVGTLLRRAEVALRKELSHATP